MLRNDLRSKHADTPHLLHHSGGGQKTNVPLVNDHVGADESANPRSFDNDADAGRLLTGRTQ